METQTDPKGQPHFFPIIMDGKALRECAVHSLTDRRPIPFVGPCEAACGIRRYRVALGAACGFVS
jgi:hypothetical protein